MQLERQRGWIGVMWGFTNGSGDLIVNFKTRKWWFQEGRPSKLYLALLREIERYLAGAAE